MGWTRMEEHLVRVLALALGGTFSEARFCNPERLLFLAGALFSSFLPIAISSGSALDGLYHHCLLSRFQLRSTER